MKGSPLQWRNVRLVPILHNRLEFAVEVRRQFHAYRPDAVAVEYPRTLEPKILQGIERLPLLSVVHYEESDGTFTYLLLEPTDGQVEAVRSALSRKIPVYFVDRDTEGYLLDRTPMPDPYAVKRLGHEAYCRAYWRIHRDGQRGREDLLRENTMAHHLQILSAEYDRVLFVGGLYHLPGLLRALERPQPRVIGRTRRPHVGLAHLHQDSSRELTTEMPYLAARYEQARDRGTWHTLDRLRIHLELINEARKNHLKKNREELTRTQMRILHRFARNYALLTGNLVPSFYQLVVAARGAADDNFAYEVWDLGSTYPWQTEAPGLPVLRLRGEDLFLDQKRIRFHRRLTTLRRRLVPVPVRKRKRERRPGEWKAGFKGAAICSYPPEDVAVEGYGDYLKKRAMEIKNEENSRVEPFTCSMLDGIDVRQTLRDWILGRKVYVREERPLRGKVGSVVVIFDPDKPGPDGKECFPWLVTWLGEHDQESDMAFYSTPAGEVMAGPGISRCRYGGFMLTYPPKRVYDIWRDPFFDIARNKPERLLMAALDYSLEKHVVYVAPEPPSGWCRSMAARLGKQIIYLPVGVFSPVTRNRIRLFHVLDGHHVRRYARDYLS
ncbi:MAG: hypothetical protein JRF59_09630 [Deltaproteobacteria bacterium]|nr:hypothetical protein [Deltaproteobacteria bacterium]MBW1924332.1 hypothetical protein [Deltaproteobacteria bacterium]MBW1948471.1 hypothetical protein [Deltaproteobacteria bacterium]MBW2007483.1 hypothetical protein [Deltaproteobacteria bacterium]MBW2102022.1 hypothetical protein [Deltaproteobacteria bacterium]